MRKTRKGMKRSFSWMSECHASADKYSAAWQTQRRRDATFMNPKCAELLSHRYVLLSATKAFWSWITRCKIEHLHPKQNGKRFVLSKTGRLVSILNWFRKRPLQKTVCNSTGWTEQKRPYYETHFKTFLKLVGLHFTKRDRRRGRANFPDELSLVRLSRFG